MKLDRITLTLLAAALAAPAAPAAAQDDCPCRRPGMIGVVFDSVGAGGARVVEVRRASPADAAGLREGDVVVVVDGAPAAERVAQLPARLQAGDTVRMRVAREGTEREVVVVAAERVVARGMPPRVLAPGQQRTIVFHADSLDRPLRELTVRIDSLQNRLLHIDSAGFRVRLDSMVRVLGDSVGRLPQLRLEMREAEARSRESALALAEGRPFFLEIGRRAAAGAELAPMNEGLARYFNGQRSGALVIEVGAGTPAERAGLQPGDVIVGAGGEPVAGPADVRRHLAARGGSVPLQVVRQGSRRELTLEWEAGRELHREEVIFRRRN